jgi:hypothetical protein
MIVIAASGPQSDRQFGPSLRPQTCILFVIAASGPQSDKVLTIEPVFAKIFI